ncbi:MAG: anhydro-N-acetylmuramic acid kinase [Litorimonas sp.]
MEKDVYTALGLMSGTSLDGVDVAIIETDGVDIFGFGSTAEAVFTPSEKQTLEAVTQDALRWRFRGPPPNSFSQGEDVIDSAHVKAIGDLSADIVGYHGQTVLHHPPLNDEKGQTLQLGRGQILADKLNIPVAFDFRTADVEAGGQGAPLAPIYHEALVRFSKLEGRVAVLNLGGVANVTAIIDGKLIWATDCGPANGPLDSWMQLNGAGNYDASGTMSFAGKVDHAVINQWLERDFFRRSVPRSADRYDFDVLADLEGVSLEDGAATLASFCVQAVARDLAVFSPDKVIVCGGGRKNPAIVAMLDIHTDAQVVTAEHVGWNGDMLEAQAFAYLAVRTLKNLPISFPETTGALRPLTGGRIAYPSKSGRSRGGE